MPSTDRIDVKTQSDAPTGSQRLPGADRLYAEGTYWRLNSTYFLDDSLFKARNIVSALQQCELGSELRICDMGCGAGGVLHELCQLLQQRGIGVAEAHGYDISEQALAKGRELFPDLQFKLGSAPQVPDGYDLILVMDVLEHLEDYYEFLRACSGKARFYVFNIPMDMNVRTVLDQSNLLARWDEGGHIHQFCEATALRVLSDTGFEIVHHRWAEAGPGLQARQTTLQRVARWLMKPLFRLRPSLAVALLGMNSLMVVAVDRANDGTAVGSPVRAAGPAVDQSAQVGGPRVGARVHRIRPRRGAALLGTGHSVCRHQSRAAGGDSS